MIYYMTTVSIARSSVREYITSLFTNEIAIHDGAISKPSSVPSTTEEEYSTPSSYHPGSLHATLLSSCKRRVYQNSINNVLDNDYQELEKLNVLLQP
jgi:hypothetical protein